MSIDTVGILTPFPFAGERPNVLDAIMREVFVNEVPLFARLRRVQATNNTYNIVAYNVRQRSYVLGTGGITTNGQTSIPIADPTPFQVGDVIDINGVERVQVTVAPLQTDTALTVARGVDNTTAQATIAAAVPMTLVGNARTGGEVDQQAFRANRTLLPQNLQTFQYAVQIGGLAEAIQNTALPPGANSVMGLERSIKLVEMVRDVENTMYYGNGHAAAAAADRPTMFGLKALISTYNSGANVTTTAGSSYTRANFIAATIAKIYAAGGLPDTILCSTDFLTGLDIWVPNKTAFMGNGRTAQLGFPITEFVLPLNATPLTFIPSLQMKPGTAAVLSSFDLDVRYIRQEFWQPRGNRGDAIMGDWIGDFAIGMNRPQWHAWVEGITSFA